MFIMPNITAGMKLNEIAKPIKLSSYMEIKAAERKQKEAIRNFDCSAPPVILYNLYDAPPDVFQKYQRTFLEKKKDMEVQIVKENKQFEIVDKVIMQSLEQDRSRS
jgi:hypothetical protein